MNFIPDGYMIPVAVREARVEAKSQLVASGAVESETELPSPIDDNKWRNTQGHDKDLPPSPADEDLPPSPLDEVHIGNPHQDVGCPPA